MAKILISIRLDRDVLEWLRAMAPTGYQTEINKILRDHYDRRRQQDQMNIGRAQQIFAQYHARCFWHLDPNLKVTAVHIPLVQAGLRKHGGRDGMLLAEEIGLAGP